MSQERMRPDLITVGEIATIAGVKPSAVSNWRRRHANFPLPQESTSAGDLFERQSVVDWLEAEGKTVVISRQQAEQALWRAADALRGSASPEDATLLMLQLLYVRREGLREPTSKAARVWTAAASAGSTAEVFMEKLLAGLAHRTPEQFRALETAASLRRVPVHALIASIDHLANQNTDWGATATDLLRGLQAALRTRGQGATPDSVAELMRALLEPIHGTVYDPACGSAMFLAEAWRSAQGGSVQLLGQEISDYAWKVGWLHLSLLDADFEIASGDTLLDDRFRSKKADRIALDPPYGARPGLDALSDERWKFGTTRGSAEWMWVQHVLYHLSDKGIGLVLVPTGALSREGHEARVRAEVVRAGQLDAVIELPPGLLHHTAIPVALLLFDMNRANRADRILFVDATQLGQTRRGKANELDAGHIEKIAEAVQSWRTGNFSSQTQFAAAASLVKIAEDGRLSPQHYVEYSSRVSAIDGEAIDDRFSRQRTETSQELRRIESIEPEVGSVLARFLSRAQQWPRVRLEHLVAARPQTGVRMDPFGKGPPVPFVATADVSGGAFRLEALPAAVTCSPTRDRTVTRGDVLLVSRGITAERRMGCGTVAFDGLAAYSESLMRIRVDEQRLLPDFLRLFLTSRQGRSALAAVTTGSVIGNLRNDALLAIEMPVPDLATQRAIVEAVATLESGITGLADSIAALEATYDTAREGIAASILTVSPGGTNAPPNTPQRLSP